MDEYLRAVEQVDLLSQISEALEFVKMIFSLFCFTLRVCIRRNWRKMCQLSEFKLKKNVSTSRILSWCKETWEETVVTIILNNPWFHEIYLFMGGDMGTEKLKYLLLSRSYQFAQKWCKQWCLIMDEVLLAIMATLSWLDKKMFCSLLVISLLVVYSSFCYVLIVRKCIFSPDKPFIVWLFGIFV